MINQKVLAVDIETTGLDFMEDKIRLISAYSDQVEIVTEDILSLKEVLEDPHILKVFHNALFDVSFLEHNGIGVRNYTDTLVIAQVLENKARGEGRSLAYLSEKYLGIYMEKSLQNASNWDAEITKEHKKYAMKDVIITFKLYMLLMAKVAENNLMEVLEREIRSLPVIVHLKIDGMKFDYNGWEDVLVLMAEEAEGLKGTIREVVGNENLNLESPQQILNTLRELGLDIHSTSDDELKKYENDHGVVPILREYKKRKKNLVAFGSKLEKAIGNDGRLRGNWSLIGTDTGRMSCSNPPMQAMPKASRPYFRAEEGHSLILADYKTIEIRILAAISKDKELLRAIKMGEDLHKKTAASIFQKEVASISEVERGVGKIINFGIVYGMSSFGIQKKVSSSIDTDISLIEAERYRQNYFKLYKNVLGYQEAMLKAMSIRTLGGRRWRDRELAGGSVKRYNYPIQAAMSEGLKESLILLLEILEEQESWRVVNIIHDEIILEVPDQDVGVAKVALENIMVDGMKQIIGDIVPINIDVEVRKSWEEKDSI